nr:MAG TPA: hypothetical protein [Caudoviricetes sp.]
MCTKLYSKMCYTVNKEHEQIRNDLLFLFY